MTREHGAPVAAGAPGPMASRQGPVLPAHGGRRGDAGDGALPKETFGPVAAVTTFREVDEAIALANDSEFGLVAGVFTTDPRLARHVSERLQVGIVNVNDVPTYWQPHTPFGGWTGKRSGVGRLGGKYTILEMSQVKAIVYDTRLG